MEQKNKKGPFYSGKEIGVKASISCSFFVSSSRCRLVLARARLSDNRMALQQF
ncbi:hypothetical protein DSUL_70003 [Desulfovibrionales bacterium]